MTLKELENGNTFLLGEGALEILMTCIKNSQQFTCFRQSTLNNNKDKVSFYLLLSVDR